MAPRKARNELDAIVGELERCAGELVRSNELALSDARMFAYRAFAVLVVSRAKDPVANIALDSAQAFSNYAETLKKWFNSELLVINLPPLSAYWATLLPTLNTCTALLAQLETGLPDALGFVYERLILSDHANLRGAFYTPPELVRFMVQRALGENSPSTILDPACGCGVFLLEAVRYLRQRSPTPETSLHIIQSCLFGIDLDPIATQICRLALQLEHLLFARSCGEENPSLLDLSAQIINANALIDSQDLPMLDQFDRNLRQRLGIVDLCAISPHFNSGFGCIICNPPYGISRNEQISPVENKILRQRYHLTRTGKINKYMLFMARCHELLVNDGRMVLVVPNAWLGIRSGIAIRKLLLEDGALNSIWSFNRPIFPGIGVEAVVFEATKHAHATHFDVERAESIYALDSSDSHHVPVAQCLANPEATIPLVWSAPGAELIAKIKESGLTLGSECSRFLPLIALQAYALGRGTPAQTAQDVRGHVFHTTQPDQDTVPYLEGADINRFQINWSGTFLRCGPWLSEFQSLERFAGPRIIIREILAPAPYLLRASFTDQPFVYNRSALHIIGRDGDADPTLMRALTAILNSRLGSVVIRLTGRKSQRSMFPKLVADDLRGFPLPADLSKIAPELASLAERIAVATRDKVADEIEAIQREIDAKVALGYGVSLESLENIALS